MTSPLLLASGPAGFVPFLGVVGTEIVLFSADAYATRLVAMKEGRNAFREVCEKQPETRWCWGLWDRAGRSVSIEETQPETERIRA